MGDCKTLSFTSVLPAVARLIGFANATSHADSDARIFSRSGVVS
jgi:hypothetical protein